MMMKKVFMGIMLSLLVSNGYAGFTDEQISDCRVNNETFTGNLLPAKKVRVGSSMRLYDVMENSGNVPLGLISKESGVATYHNLVGAYINANNQVTKDDGDFQFTNWINEKKGILYPNEKGKIVESRNKFVIPTKGQLEETYGENLVNMNKDFMIKYYYGYQTVVDGKKVGKLKKYLGCQPYQVSWCGDGVLDKEYDEVCDPQDPKKQGWVMGQCSNTCTTSNSNHQFVKPNK